jgi:hypothetical protein
MKAIHSTTFTSLIVLLLGLLPLQLLTAQGEPSPSQHKHHQSRLLIHLLKIDAAEIAELRRTLERIEGMSSEEKQALEERVLRLHKMPPDAAQKLHQRYQSIPPEEREAMRQRWREMSFELRKAWRQRMNALEPEQRLEQIRKEGILPGHRYDDKCEGMPMPPKNAKRPAPAPLETVVESPTPTAEN